MSVSILLYLDGNIRTGKRGKNSRAEVISFALPADDERRNARRHRSCPRARQTSVRASALASMRVDSGGGAREERRSMRSPTKENDSGAKAILQGAIDEADGRSLVIGREDF